MTKGKASAKKKASAPRISGMPSKQESDMWRAKADADTLVSAEEVKRDSARMKAAQAQAKKRMEELARVVKK